MVLKITVKTLDSNNYEFEANDDWTVRQFKENIQETVQAPADEQRLIFCGRVLLDDKKLAEYDCNEKVIHLVRRLPPPPNGPDQAASSGIDPNNNTSTSSDGSNENSRFLDEGQIFINAMTVGPESVNYILRQILTLQQAAYVRGFVDGPPVGTASEPLTMTSLDRHLHNAARLLRITVNIVNECMARIAVLPPAAPRFASANLSSESHRPSIIASASSHTDLQRDTEMPSGENQQQRSQHPSDVTVDDMGVGPDNGASPRRAQVRNMPRQSLTTDDLPQSTRPAHRFVPATLRSQTEIQRAPLALRQRNESELDRYLSLVNYASDLQNQFQGLSRRYRQLIDMSRRGGLIVPQSSSTNNPVNVSSSESPQSSTSDTAGQPVQASPPTLVNEARILASYIPRIMHHISHLQHALSDFSVDFERGTLQLNVSTNERTNRLRQAARRSTPPQSTHATRSDPRTAGTQNGRLPTRPHGVTATVNIHPERQHDTPGVAPTIEGSVTITATTVETSPLLSTSTSGLMPQANATIVVTSEPLQSGFRFPISLDPINLGPGAHEAVPGSVGSQPNVPIGEQQRGSPPQNTTSNSTQTATRPLRVVSGRLPPFDFFLPCLSPWAVNTYRNPSGGSQTPNRAQVRTTRQQQATAPSPSAPRAQADTSAAQPTDNVNRQPRAAPSANPLGELVGQLFMGGPLQARTAASSAQPTVNLGNNSNSFINMIPEIALNAASQILGGVLGIPTTNQQPNNQPAARQQQPSTGSVMMDIDIDDGSSSQSESRYHDARESHSPMAATTRQNESISRSTSIPPQQATHSRDVPPAPSSSHACDRRRLESIMQNHPDWLPIIEADISLMESQAVLNSNQPAFSDAYLSSIPRKRRRLFTTNSDRVLILQPSPSQAISNLLRRAITSSSVQADIESLDQVLLSISNDVDVQSAYDDFIKTAVEARLRSDFDYCPQKFENSSKYFK